MADVLFTEHNILANEQQHFEQSESVYDINLIEKVDRNTTPKSTDMTHMGKEIDQNANAKKCQVLCPLPDPSFDNMTTEFSNQFLETENISLKKTIAQLQKDLSRMETHCINIELKYQNQALKNGQHGQILNETKNAMLNKENEHLKQTYKDLSDSIKKISVQTKDYADSLIVQQNLTPHYLPKVRESAPAKPRHVNAPSSSRNSKKESSTPVLHDNGVCRQHFRPCSLKKRKKSSIEWCKEVVRVRLQGVTKEGGFLGSKGDDGGGRVLGWWQVGDKLDVVPTVVHTAAPNSEHVNKWTKDHPLDNIIGELGRPVSTRLQLYEQVLFCYYDAFLSSDEHKTYKDALTQACWIKAMQEELNEFEHLEVKLDELGEILKNKARLVSCGYRQEEEIDFEEFSKGTLNPTLFIKIQDKDILLSKYALESLKKYGMESSDPVDTPMVEKSKLYEDLQRKAIDPTHYRGMFGTLMYLTASRPELTFVVCMCARGLWYPKDSSIALTAYADADHTGCQDTRRKHQSDTKVFTMTIEILLESTSNKLSVAPRLEFCAGEGGLKSWEWCGGSGVDWRGGEVVLSSWREKRLKCYSASYLNVGGTSTVIGYLKMEVKFKHSTFLGVPKENSFEALKLLENSVEVLKILKNKLESMKILENKLDSLKLQENQPVDGLVPLFIKKIYIRKCLREAVKE
nr:hypothetical protein [Tanacetum cinerariifolium]